MNSTSRKFLIIGIFLSLAVGFVGGFWFANNKSANDLPIIRELINKDVGQPAKLDFSLFWDVWNSLNEKYVDPSKLDTQKMLYGAINGMVNSVGDPYTVFLEPKISKKFQEEISGAFGGVGMEIGKRNDVLTVIAPLKDTPAARAGIKAGDKILKIDGKITGGLSVEEAVNLIRGKKGTKVVLTVSDNGNTKDVELIRDTVKIPSVEWELLDGDIAYLQVYTFNQNVDSEFQKAAEQILKSPATKLIVDLRNNPGGLLDSSINLAGWFLNQNQVITMQEFRDGKREEFKSKGNGALRIYQTLFLINGGSASASEILAGAVHDNLNIQLIGEKSFGKGSVQQLEEFKNGSSLKVTIAKWLTPNGRSITDLGIEPNVEVKMPEDPKEGEIELGTPGKDPQLDKALELLK
ncbi:MAG: S41 family peptidase [bacterium]|nr:S41 family peptidase [bacterium]